MSEVILLRILIKKCTIDYNIKYIKCDFEKIKLIKTFKNVYTPSKLFP